MLNEGIRDRVRTVLGPVRVVYGAMIGSVLVYWIVVQVIRKVGQIPRGRDMFAAVDWLRYPLYVLGIAACVAVILLRRGLFNADRVAGLAQGRTLPEILSGLSSQQIMVFAVAEVPVILGLALYFVGGYLIDFYALAGVSLIGFALARPSAADWERALGSISRARPDLLTPAPPAD
jgi:hypothetical protein